MELTRHLRRPGVRLACAAAVAAGIVTLLVWPHHVDGLIGWLASIAPMHGSDAGVERHDFWWLLEDLGNVTLFVPLGLAIAWWTRRPWAGFAAGALISAACEIAQHWIPNRDSSVLDFACNATGAMIGALLARWLLRRTEPESAPGSATREAQPAS